MHSQKMQRRGKWMPSNENVLVRLRQKNNMTQVQLAKICGVSQQYISKYENGTIKISRAQGEMLLKLSRALNCTIEDLLIEETEEYKYECR